MRAASAGPAATKSTSADRAGDVLVLVAVAVPAPVAVVVVEEAPPSPPTPSSIPGRLRRWSRRTHHRSTRRRSPPTRRSCSSRCPRRVACRLQSRHGLRRPLVVGRCHDVAALRAERALEVLRQQARVVHVLVVHDRRGARAQLVGGELGARGGLRVVAEAGEEEPVGHLLREPRRGRAAGHERHAGAGRDGRRGEHLVGVGEADDGRAAGGDEARRRPLHVGLVGLAVALQELDAPAHEAAARVDAVDREARAVEGRAVERGLVAGEVVDRPDAHRGRRGVASPSRCCRRPRARRPAARRAPTLPSHARTPRSFRVSSRAS